MVESTELSHEELIELRDAQACKVQPMGHHELSAYRGGYPPGDRCIATPTELKTAYEDAYEDALNSGTPKEEIVVAFSPLALAREALDQMFPDFKPTPALGSSFDLSSANSPAPAPNEAFSLDFTRNV